MTLKNLPPQTTSFVHDSLSMTLYSLQIRDFAAREIHYAGREDYAGNNGEQTGDTCRGKKLIN